MIDLKKETEPPLNATRTDFEASENSRHRFEQELLRLRSKNEFGKEIKADNLKGAISEFTDALGEGSNVSFTPPEKSLLYRGPWVIDADAIKLICLLSLFFDRIYLPGYSIVPDGPDREDIVEALHQLALQSAIEAFILDYHNYMAARFRPEWPGKLIESLAREGILPRVKIYGNLKGLSDGATIVPLLATIYDMEDSSYRSFLSNRMDSLAAFRFPGRQKELDERLWAWATNYIDAVPSTLSSAGFEKEAAMVNEQLQQVPLKVFDYAYYLNLGFHWTTVFRKSWLYVDERETDVYFQRFGAHLDKGISKLSTAASAYVQLPFFPGLNDVPILELVKVRRELAKETSDMREYFNMVSNLKYANTAGEGFSPNTDQMKEFMLADLWERSSKALGSYLSKGSKLLESGMYIGINAASLAFPPLGALGFIGPVKEIYQTFNQDPVLFFTLKLGHKARNGSV